MFDSFGGDQFIGNLLHQWGFATHDEDLQAVMVVEVDVQSGDDCLMMVVLNVS